MHESQCAPACFRDLMCCSMCMNDSGSSASHLPCSLPKSKQHSHAHCTGIRKRPGIAEAKQAKLSSLGPKACIVSDSSVAPAGDDIAPTVHDSTTSLSAPSQEASPSLKKLPPTDDSSSSLDDSPPFSMVTLGCVVKDGLSLRTQWEFLKLGMPGGMMMAAEASSFDITTAMAGLLGGCMRLRCLQRPSQRKDLHSGCQTEYYMHCSALSRVLNGCSLDVLHGSVGLSSVCLPSATLQVVPAADLMR